MRRRQAALAVFAAVFVMDVSLLPHKFQAPAAPLGLGDFRDLPFKGWTSIVREDGLAHLLAYSVLAFLVRGALRSSPRAGWVDAGRDFAAGALCVVLAATLEFVQQYVPARGFELGETLSRTGRPDALRITCRRRATLLVESVNNRQIRELRCGYRALDRKSDAKRKIMPLALPFVH